MIGQVNGTHKHSGRTVAVVKERGDGRKPGEKHHRDDSLCELIQDDGTRGKLVWIPRSSLRTMSKQEAARLTASWVQPLGAAPASRGPAAESMPSSSRADQTSTVQMLACTCVSPDQHPCSHQRTLQPSSHVLLGPGVLTGRHRGSARRVAARAATPIAI